MTAQRFEGIMISIVPALIEAYMVKTGKSIAESIREVYTSKLYSALEDKDTALWHLSSALLADILLSERNHSTIVLPEEQ